MLLKKVVTHPIAIGFVKLLIQTTKTPRHNPDSYRDTKITLCYSVTLCLCGSNLNPIAIG